MEKKEVKINLRASDDILKGVYSNNLMIARTGEEFILDFINLVPPHAFVTSRIVVSPVHMKRMVAAMQDSVAKYEEAHGEIKQVPAPMVADGLKQ